MMVEAFRITRKFKRRLANGEHSTGRIGARNTGSAKRTGRRRWILRFRRFFQFSAAPDDQQKPWRDNGETLPARSYGGARRGCRYAVQQTWRWRIVRNGTGAMEQNRIHPPPDYRGWRRPSGGVNFKQRPRYHAHVACAALLYTIVQRLHGRSVGCDFYDNSTLYVHHVSGNIVLFVYNILFCRDVYHIYHYRNLIVRFVK